MPAANLLSCGNDINSEREREREREREAVYTLYLANDMTLIFNKDIVN